MAAHYEVVDGMRLPAKLSGHASLDFCNTLVGWDGHDPSDYLASYVHLAVWAGFAELLPGDRVTALREQAARHADEAQSALEQARAFRGHLYELLMSDTGFPDVAREIDAAASHLRLHRAGEAAAWEIDPAAGLRAPLAAAAWSAGEFLTSSERSLVRACPGPGCGWLFLDRRGRRRWCTMATCGNREKVRRFAARQRGAEG